jgi:hypothetical protein
MADADDPHHESALEIVRRMDHGELPTGRVTNYIVQETLNWIHNRKRHAKAAEMYEQLNQSAGFEIIHTAQKDFHRAVEVFRAYEGLSFGDSTIVAYMRRAETGYLYSFDDDFDVIDDITRLETADNPFN